MSELVRRLLGPAGPELGCAECFEHLDEEVERELAGLPVDPAFRAHLAGCPACREEHESLLALVRRGRA